MKLDSGYYGGRMVQVGRGVVARVGAAERSSEMSMKKLHGKLLFYNPSK